MSKVESQLKESLVSEELFSMYHSLLEKASRELPKLDGELVMNMLTYQSKYATPSVRLYITFKPSIVPAIKKKELFEKTGRSAEIRHGNLFVIDPFITLQGLEELSKDKDIEKIEGTIIP
jgi:hypothetical protein